MAHKLYNKGKFTIYDMIRGSPEYKLLYAIKKRAIKDLAYGIKDRNLQESDRSLIEFCRTFFVEDKEKNDILINRAIKERAKHMKINLNEMYDMLSEDTTPATATPVNVADEIEEQLQSQTPTPAPTPAPAPIISNEEREEKTNEHSEEQEG